MKIADCPSGVGPLIFHQPKWIDLPTPLTGFRTENGRLEMHHISGFRVAFLGGFLFFFAGFSRKRRGVDAFPCTNLTRFGGIFPNNLAYRKHLIC